jgi:hypothetical protein
MSKQTAIRWLGYELNTKLFYDITPELWEQVNEIFNQALEMEREQIELAFDEGLEYEYEHHINGYPRIEPSTYYKETYGGQDESK